jgi:hypothetical protein
MIQDEWQPEEKDVEWTREQFKRMSVGDTWGVADAVLRKDDDNTLKVIQASPSSILPLERIKKVCEVLEVSFDVSEAELINDPERAAQEAAKEWVHPESEIPITNFDLENAQWNEVTHEGMQGAWEVVVEHESDDPDNPHRVTMTPMDYHLVAGDELFFSWRGQDGLVWRVIEREEIIALADSGTFLEPLAFTNEMLLVMPTMYEGVVIPPHLRGLIFTPRPRDEEE